MFVYIYIYSNTVAIATNWWHAMTFCACEIQLSVAIWLCLKKTALPHHCFLVLHKINGCDLISVMDCDCSLFHVGHVCAKSFALSRVLVQLPEHSDRLFCLFLILLQMSFFTGLLFTLDANPIRGIEEFCKGRLFPYNCSLARWRGCVWLLRVCRRRAVVEYIWLQWRRVNTLRHSPCWPLPRQ